MEKLDELKLLLGIDNNLKDDILLFILSQVSDFICIYCNLDTLPDKLNNIMLSMAVDIYKAEGFGDEKKEGVVKSMTQGDLSITFGSFYESNPSAEFFKCYKNQLDVFRKAGW